MYFFVKIKLIKLVQEYAQHKATRLIWFGTHKEESN